MVLYPKEVNLTIVNGEEWLWNPAKFFVVCFYWELKQTMAAVETNTSPNKRFNERNNEYAPAFFKIFVHFVAALYKRQVLRSLENADRKDNFLVFLSGTDC